MDEEDHIYSKIDSVEKNYVRNDILNEKMSVIHGKIENIDEKIQSMLDERNWLVRIVLGSVVLGVMGLVLVKAPL